MTPVGKVNIRLPEPVAPVAPGWSPAGQGFAQVIGKALQQVQGLQNQAHDSAARFLAGENVELHQVALDHQRAALAFDLLLQVRNKAVQTYQEIMRMPV